ncbi:MAG: DUF4886 domain-containing protein [Bacteroidales bacterium]|nr:DUF4886 domain-containing protein [Bacteroidales bacterium]
MKRVLTYLLILFTTATFAQNTIQFPITNNPLPKDSDSLRVLMIGNSFTFDLTRVIGNILRASGIDNNTCCVYILWESGASLTHWDKWYIEKDTFKLSKMGGNLDAAITEGTVQELLSQNWDVVSLQQTSNYSTDIDSYSPYLYDMIRYIKQDCANKNVSICWQLTWSYWDGIDKIVPKEEEGWKEIVATADKMISKYGIDIIIPSGTAVENARKTRLNTPHSLTRDGHHMAYGAGQYLLACTLFETIFKPIYNVSILTNWARPAIPQEYKDDSKYEYVDVTDETAYLCQQCAIAAVEDWHSITLVDTTTIEKPSFYIFPNPATDTITIQNASFIENFSHTIQIELYDILGNLLRNEKGLIVRDYTIDVSQLHSGQYYLVIRNNGASGAFPFIKL